jgi:hypothetical protein
MCRASDSLPFDFYIAHFGPKIGNTAAQYQLFTGHSTQAFGWNINCLEWLDKPFNG